MALAGGMVTDLLVGRAPKRHYDESNLAHE
jgi:hypothetical protein